jgi:hypothetical protein
LRAKDILVSPIWQSLIASGKHHAFQMKVARVFRERLRTKRWVPNRAASFAAVGIFYARSAHWVARFTAKPLTTP